MKKYNIKEKFEKRCQYSGKMRNKNYYYLENSDELERIQKWKRLFDWYMFKCTRSVCKKDRVLFEIKEGSKYGFR